jgi:very-short-patch-repair endonuclease
MQIVKAWLDELGEHYVMDEHLCYGVFPDFNLPVRSLIIEVDGRGFHERCEWLDDDRRRRDAMKDELYTLEGYRILRLPESVVTDGTGKTLLIQHLEVRA